MHFIVKLFPEITIKSPPVRKRMTRQLRDNLRKLLAGIDPAIHLQQDWEKIQIVGPEDDGNCQICSNTALSVGRL